MRLSVRVCSVFVSVTFLLTSGAFAQSLAEPQTITVTPFVSAAFGTSDGLGGSAGLGVAVAYDFTSNLGAEGEFTHLFDVAGNDPNVDSSVQNYNANAIYHFGLKHATPYATFGLGVEHIGRSVKDPATLALYPPPATEITYNFGGGVKYPLSQNFLVRGDMRRFQANDLAPNYWRLYAGLTWWIKR